MYLTFLAVIIVEERRLPDLKESTGAGGFEREHRICEREKVG